jgi:hypothetical protein
MCIAADIYAQKFGLQRAQGYTGVTNEQKELNQFDTAVYYPTNWHNSQYETLKSKFPAFIRYGGLVPISPEFLTKNYLGIYPIGQQPTIDESKPYQIQRLS